MIKLRGIRIAGIFREKNLKHVKNFGKNVQNFEF